MSTVHVRLFVPDEAPSAPRKQAKSHRLPDFLRAAEWERLVAVAAAEVARKQVPSKHRAAMRDEMAVHIGLYCGLRISEICGLDCERIDIAERRLLVFQGKGGKDGFVAIPTKLVDRLRVWLDGKAGPLFVTERGKRLCIRTLAWRLERLGKIAGLNRQLHCHKLRHSFAMRLLETGADIRQIMQLMRHARLSSTAQYLHCDTSRLQETVERL